MHKAKPIFWIGCLILIMIVAGVAPALLRSGYRYSPDDSSYLRDYLGRKITVPVSIPKRIISLSPSNTEILFALGAGDRIVGVTEFSDYPEEAKKIPRVGSFQNPDVEKIVSVSPDIVFSAGELHSRQIKLLERAGIPVIAIEPKTMLEVLDAMRLIAGIIGEEETGRRLTGELQTKLAMVKAITSQAAPRRVFVEVWDSPFLTIGGKSYLSDIVSHAGGINVAAGKNLDYMTCDFEMLYAFNPDTYVIVRQDGISRGIEMDKNPHLQNVPAIRDNRVYQLSDDILSRPGPRSFEGLIEMAQILHPDLKKGWQRP